MLRRGRRSTRSEQNKRVRANAVALDDRIGKARGGEKPETRVMRQQLLLRRRRRRRQLLFIEEREREMFLSLFRSLPDDLTSFIHSPIACACTLRTDVLLNPTFCAKNIHVSSIYILFSNSSFPLDKHTNVFSLDDCLLLKYI